jgi:hypothetical protein
LVAHAEQVLELGELVGAHQCEHAAAESAAHHTRPGHAVEAVCDINHEVQLGAGHLKLILQAIMAGEQQSPGGLDLPGLQGHGHLLHAAVFVGDIADAAQDGRLDLARDGGEHVILGLAEEEEFGVAGAQGGEAGLAFGAALVVGGIGEGVFDAAVAEQEAVFAEVGRDLLVAEAAAVEEQEVVAPAHEHGDLVHDAALHARESVLGRLRDAREGKAVAPLRVQGIEAQGQARAQGRRRRQPRAQRDVPAKDKPESRTRVFQQAEAVHHARDVARPRLLRQFAVPACELELFAEVVRAQGASAVLRRAEGEVHGAVDGGGHDIAVGVVGVLPDEVDAAGRPHRHRRRDAEAHLECGVDGHGGKIGKKWDVGEGRDCAEGRFWITLC